MSKRLIMILALVFAVGIVGAAYAEVQNVKVSGDITVYGIYRNLGLKDHKANADGDYKSLASIVRLRVDADLTDNVIATIRLLNERYWGGESYHSATSPEPSGKSNVNSDISLDLAYVTLKEFLYTPLTLVVGRQELHFGSEMIVGDIDTNNTADPASPFSVSNATGRDADLSARKAFDAIRATLNYDPLVVDVIFAKARESYLNYNDDTDLYGVNLNYAVNKTTTAEAYYFEKRAGKKTAGVNSKADKVDTIGARIAGSPAAGSKLENLTYSLEAAMQLGKYYVSGYREADRLAFALEGAVGYNFKKVKYTPTVSLLGAYFSGEKHEYTSNDSKRYRGWDPMYENQKFGDIANALFNQTNAKIIGLMAAAKPLDDVSVKGEYYVFWWDKAYPDNHTISTARGDSIKMTNRKFVGTELDLSAVYDYTEDVQFSLLYGTFFPGNAIHSENKQRAVELLGCMKVTF